MPLKTQPRRRTARSKPGQKLVKDHHISKVPDGYLVRVTIRGKLHQTFIAKGRRNARGIARRARDKLLAAVPAMTYEKGYPIALVVSRSNTGFAGLSYTLSRKGDCSYEVIKATARVQCGVTKGRSFFLSTWGGYEEAILAALDWRESQLGARRRAVHRQR